MKKSKKEKEEQTRVHLDQEKTFARMIAIERLITALIEELQREREYLSKDLQVMHLILIQNRDRLLEEINNNNVHNNTR